MLIREYIFAKSSPVHWIRGFFRIRFYLFLFSGTPILHVITVKFSNFHCLRKNDYESFISINVKNMVGKKMLTLTPFTSSSSNEPISKASAAFTSPRGGINGGTN